MGQNIHKIPNYRNLKSNAKFKKRVRGKNLADIIEAIVGLVLQTYGWEFALNSLVVLGIIPENFETFEKSCLRR